MVIVVLILVIVIVVLLHLDDDDDDQQKFQLIVGEGIQIKEIEILMIQHKQFRTNLKNFSHHRVQVQKDGYRQVNGDKRRVLHRRIKVQEVFLILRDCLTHEKEKRIRMEKK